MSFRSATELNVGHLLSSIAAGNVDPQASGGEHLDVVVADETGVVRWLQGRGGGAFRTRPNLAVTGRPRTVVVQDLTGDGFPDIVSASAESGTVALFTGRGDGTFTGPIEIAAVQDPRATVVLDDLVAVTDAATNRVVLLRADPSATLSIAGDLEVAAEPRALASGDLDGDGALDLAVGNGAGASVLLLRRSGDTFVPTATIPVGTAVSAVALGDVNADGRADLIVAEEAGGLAVFANNGRAGFSRVFTATVGPEPIALAILDDRSPGFEGNGDGRADLLVLNRGANDVAVLNGFGDGRFEMSARLVVGSEPVGFAVGDFVEDETGAADIVTANRGSASLSVVRSNGGGSFQAALSFATGPRPIAALSADFDRDGWPDVVTLNAGDGTVSFLRGNGRGALRAPVSVAALPDPTAIAAGDFDGNGFLDLAVTSADSGRAVTLPNSIAGFGLQRPVDFGGAVDRLRSADLNGDGLDDLVAMQRALNRVVFALSRGESFAPPLALEIPGTLTAMTLARAVGDSNWDIVIGTSDPPAVAVFPGGGDFFTAPVRTALSLAPEDLVVDDFIVDGVPDVAAMSRANQRLFVLAGNGDGSFTRVEDLPVPASATGLVAADFNGNGAADLALAVPSSDRIVVFAGTGFGQFLRSDFAVGRGPNDILVANLNVVLDATGGLPELLTANADANTVTVLRNNSRATALPFTPTPTVGPGTPTPREPPSPIPTPTRRPRSSGSSGGCQVNPARWSTPYLAIGLLLGTWLRRKRSS